MLKSSCKSLYFSLRAALLRLCWKRQRASVTLPAAPAILVMRLDRVGDLVLSTPVLKLLRRQYPGSRICMLVNPGAADVVRNNPNINEMFIYTGFFSTLRALRGKFDIVIDLLMDNKLKSALLVNLLDPRQSIGFDIEGKAPLFTTPVSPGTERKHIIDYHLDLLKPLRCQAIINEDKYPEIFADTQTRADVAQWLQRQGITAEHLIIALHPGGYYPSQRWPEGHFARLTVLLAQRYPRARFILLGGRAEKPVIENIRSGINTAIQEKVFPICDIPLIRMIELIRAARLFIGNNSGPLHVACAVRTPTVSTMGPAIPWMWHPYGDPGKNIVLCKELACSACGIANCADHRCMNLITPEEMFHAAERLIENR